jgi:hypothetical protein
MKPEEKFDLYDLFGTSPLKSLLEAQLMEAAASLKIETGGVGLIRLMDEEWGIEGRFEGCHNGCLESPEGKELSLDQINESMCDDLLEDSPRYFLKWAEYLESLAKTLRDRVESRFPDGCPDDEDQL